MAMTDPVGDLLTRIRNGQAARLDSVTVPASKHARPTFSMCSSARATSAAGSRKSCAPA